MFAGRNWQPHAIERVTRVLDTNTKPLLAVTDEGLAVVKFIGNPAGLDALVCELIGSELANMIGLQTPDFAIYDIPELELPNNAWLQVDPGPAFFSRWDQTATSLSPDSVLLKKLRQPEDLAKLVVLDTWLRNKDRFDEAGDDGYENVNFDNVLLRPDKRKVQMLVIDWTHAIAETTLEDDLSQGWVDEQKVYGMFPQFAPFVTLELVQQALECVNKIDPDEIQGICRGVPPDWGMTQNLADRLSTYIIERGKKLDTWLPAALFDQYEMNLEQGKGV